MMKEEICDAGGDGGINWARVCDMCRSVACTVYCRADSAYLCAGCDARVHAANRVASCLEHVRVCEACERAPAAFLCKADAASLCTACDADIHSANPLARRHQRVPILPIPGCLYVPSAAETEDGFMETEIDETIAEEDEEEAASWLLLNPGKNSTNQNTGFLFSGEVDEYLDLVEYNSSVESQFTDQYNQLQQHYGGDSVVPIQSTDAKDHLKQKQHQTFQFGLGYDSSKAAYSYNGSISHSLSLSSVDHEVVQESSMCDIPTLHTRPFKGTIDLFSGPSIQMPSQLTPMDREARVLRYREKKKTRKFEKTIRYASRKAYAEVRPRIKGRFVKRMDAEVEVDQMSLMMETGYGIVPTF